MMTHLVIFRMKYNAYSALYYKKNCWHFLLHFLSLDVETFRLQLQKEAKLSQKQSRSLQQLEDDYEAMKSQLELEKSKLELSLEEKEEEIKMMKVIIE